MTDRIRDLDDGRYSGVIYKAKFSDVLFGIMVGFVLPLLIIAIGFWAGPWWALGLLLLLAYRCCGSYHECARLLSYDPRLSAGDRARPGGGAGGPSGGIVAALANLDPFRQAGVASVR